MLSKSSQISYRAKRQDRELRLTNPAWAWEYLRRNTQYQQDYNRNRSGAPTPVKLSTGCLLLRESRRWPDAEKWGLLTFEDPAKPTSNANVFWRPDLLAGALKVQLHPIEDGVMRPDIAQDEIILSRIKTKRVVLSAVDKTVHMLMGGERFWIHLYCENARAVNDRTRVGVQIEGMKHFQRRLDTASQLLSLYQSSGKKLSLIGRNKSSKRLADGLIAFDIIQDGGSHRDAAIGVYGFDTVSENWSQSGSYLEDATRRLIHRAHHLVDSGYCEFLTKKNI